MLVRPYTKEDLPEIQAMHASQGFAYELPDLDAPQMLVRAVVEENNEITDAFLLRKTSEAYWLFRPGQRKRERIGKMLMFAKELVGPATRAGFDDVHAFLPPEIVNQTLHRTLLNLGWVKPLWVCYSRKVNL
jgi:hypothetical protein